MSDFNSVMISHLIFMTQEALLMELFHVTRKHLYGPPAYQISHALLHLTIT
jgi:hypothetical protein